MLYSRGDTEQSRSPEQEPLRQCPSSSLRSSKAELQGQHAFRADLRIQSGASGRASVRCVTLVPVHTTDGRILVTKHTYIPGAYDAMISPVALLSRSWRSAMSSTVQAGAADFSRLERGASVVTRGAGTTPPDLDLASAIREAEAAEAAARQRVLELQAAEAEHGAVKARLADLKKALQNADGSGSSTSAAGASQRQQGAPSRGLLAARKNLGMKKRSAASMARLATARQVCRYGASSLSVPPAPIHGGGA